MEETEAKVVVAAETTSLNTPRQIRLRNPMLRVDTLQTVALRAADS